MYLVCSADCADSQTAPGFNRVTVYTPYLTPLDDAADAPVTDFTCHHCGAPAASRLGEVDMIEMLRDAAPELCASLNEACDTTELRLGLAHAYNRGAKDAKDSRPKPQPVDRAAEAERRKTQMEAPPQEAPIRLFFDIAPKTGVDVDKLTDDIRADLVFRLGGHLDAVARAGHSLLPPKGIELPDVDESDMLDLLYNKESATHSYFSQKQIDLSEVGTAMLLAYKQAGAAPPSDTPDRPQLFGRAHRAGGSLDLPADDTRRKVRFYIDTSLPDGVDQLALAGALGAAIEHINTPTPLCYPDPLHAVTFHYPFGYEPTPTEPESNPDAALVANRLFQAAETTADNWNLGSEWAHQQNVWSPDGADGFDITLEELSSGDMVNFHVVVTMQEV